MLLTYQTCFWQGLWNNPCSPKIPLSTNDAFCHSCRNAFTFAVWKRQESFLPHCGKADVWGFGKFVKGRVKRKHGWFSALTEEATFHWPMWSSPLFTCTELKRVCWYSWGLITSEWRHRFLHNEQQDSKGYQSSESFSVSSSMKTRQLDLCWASLLVLYS